MTNETTQTDEDLKLWQATPKVLVTLNLDDVDILDEALGEYIESLRYPGWERSLAHATALRARINAKRETLLFDEGDNA